MKLAKIRHRVMATIVDNLIIFLVMMVALVGVWPGIVYKLAQHSPLSLDLILKLVSCGMIYALFLLSYYMLVPIFLPGQTIGKWIFKIKVVKENNENIDYSVLFFREAICRILVRTLSLGMSSLVSFLIMIIRDDQKGFGDVFAKTKVIDIKEEV